MIDSIVLGYIACTVYNYYVTQLYTWLARYLGGKAWWTNCARTISKRSSANILVQSTLETVILGSNSSLLLVPVKLLFSRYTLMCTLPFTNCLLRACIAALDRRYITSACNRQYMRPTMTQRSMTCNRRAFNL